MLFPKSNRLHVVDIFLPFFFCLFFVLFYQFEVYSIDSSKMMGNFLKSSLNCNQLLFHL